MFVSYGKVPVLKGISLSVDEKEIVAILGANGSGKTTLLKTISGILSPSKGEIRFFGERINQVPPHQITKFGIIHVPEGRKIFPRLSVAENLKMGAFLLNKKWIKEGMERVFSLFPILKERFHQLGGTLSGGEQQMLALGRAIMAKPKLLLLDEPSMGIAPMLVEKIFITIKEINKREIPILLVEQNAHKSLEIADRAYILETGRIVLEGKTSLLIKNEDVKAAYLG
ncbi:MAG: ABC transporter ATP-binding protein, partial [bacterium]